MQKGPCRASLAPAPTASATSLASTRSSQLPWKLGSQIAPSVLVILTPGCGGTHTGPLEPSACKATRPQVLQQLCHHWQKDAHLNRYNHVDVCQLICTDVKSSPRVQNCLMQIVYIAQRACHLPEGVAFSPSFHICFVYPSDFSLLCLKI